MKTFLLIACIALAGCATATMNSGQDFATGNVAKITKGVTTVAQVEDYVGTKPYSRSTQSDGTERLMWFYSETSSHAQSYVLAMNVKTQTTGKRLTITAKDGIVQSVSYTEGPLNPYGS